MTILNYPSKYIYQELILVFFFIFFIKSHAQQTVTNIYGDLGGFFTSSTSARNTYSDSNNLLGFTVDGITYSTAVNDAILSTNGITFTPSEFIALPIPANIDYNSSELIGVGANWGGLPQTNSTNDFIRTFSPIVPSFFVRDGNKGLELSTNFFNIKSQTITYDAIVINQAVSINDAKPDIIITQTGAPSSRTDEFKFIDSNGNTVGSALNVVFNGVSIVGGTNWTIYRVSPASGLVTGLFGANTYRDLRIIAFKLSDFGITINNFNQITNFVHSISGTTDIAFSAFNANSLEIELPATELEVSNSNITADNFCAPTTASFQTTITNNSSEIAKDFEVPFLLPSGTSVTSSNANFSMPGVPLTTAIFKGTQKEWTVVELEPGESVTLTVNTSVSTTLFPISFSATANLIFQQDSNPSNNNQTITESGNDTDCDGILDVNDLDDDNDGILDSIEGTGDFDGDGIPNNLDLDSDGDQCPDALEGSGTVNISQLDANFVIIGSVNSNGVPILAEAGSGSGQALGGSQNLSVKSCNTSDTDSDGIIDIVDLDDDNDGILDVNEGTGNLDGDTFSNDLDTDSDGDGCPDALEGSNNFTFANLDINNRLIGGVDSNGVPLVATSNGQTVGDSQNNSVQASSCNVSPVIISQVYQTSTGSAIELTNIGSTTVNSIRLALFKDIGNSSPNGIVPSASIQVPTINAKSSVIIKSISNIPGVTIVNSPTELTNGGVMDIVGSDDILVLSTTLDATSWANRYDVVSNIGNTSSMVRIDEVTKANTIFTVSEWMYFIDDNITVLGDIDPIPINARHGNAPLLSEVQIPNIQANNGLGLHRINPTIRLGNIWTNGFPDKSRKVIVQENYNHTGSNLKARILDVQENSVLSVNNNAIVVIDNVNINNNAEIRVLSSGQFVQVHEGASEVTGNGKLLISQKSELPNTFRYNYWSSPVLESVGGTTYRVSQVMKDAGGNLTATSTVNDIDFISGFDGAPASPIQIASYWVWAFFNETSRDDWVQLRETSYLNKGLGFTMKSTGVNPQYFIFSGSPTDGNISFNMSGNTTSLLGNPYAGTLDGRAFILNNENVIDGTLYFWEHSGESQDLGHSKFGYEGGYAQLNFAMATAANSVVQGIKGLTSSYTYTVPTRYIAAGQGFFVSSDSDGGTIRFNNKQRSFQSTAPYFFKEKEKTSSSNKLPILKLGIDFKNVNNLTIHRQIGISFKENNSFAYDYGYDSKMIDAKPTDMYWSFKEMENEKLVIAGIQNISDNLSIPLSIIINSDDAVYLKVDEILNINKNIYLYDNITKTSKELKINEVLKLELPKGNYEGRFYITFKENITLSTDKTENSQIDLKVYINTETKKLSIIKENNFRIKKVEAFNLLGQKIKTWVPKQQQKRLELITDDLSSLIYIIKVKTDNTILTKKIIKE